MKKQNEFRLALPKTNSSRNINLARGKLVFLFDVHVSEVSCGPPTSVTVTWKLAMRAQVLVIMSHQSPDGETVWDNTKESTPSLLTRTSQCSREEAQALQEGSHRTITRRTREQRTKEKENSGLQT